MAERIDPPVRGGERELLLAQLTYERATLRMKCEGLAAEQLRSCAVPPSTLSLLGLVRHLAEVERVWFRIRFNREPLEYLWVSADHWDAEFHVADADADAVAEAFARWDEEMARADAIIAAHDLEAEFHEERRGACTLRWLLMHLITEYARHNGHADLLREVTDGTVGD